MPGLFLFIAAFLFLIMTNAVDETKNLPVRTGVRTGRTERFLICFTAYSFWKIWNPP